MDKSGSTTPTKLGQHEDELSIATPSGGKIFNPFHREFLNRVGQVTFSPGIFSHNISPIGKSDSKKNTPNRIRNAFILSPDMQGDLFPVEIDENPTLQLKLQETLDTQCDDDLQSTIHSFFKNHLIAPSPDTHPNQLNRRSFTLPRTSSLLPTVTPKGKNAVPELNASPVSVLEVGVQTALSVPPSCDFESVIRFAMANLSNHCEIENENPVKLLDNYFLSNDINLSACTVHRSEKKGLTKRVEMNTSGIKTRQLGKLNRRSLFSESSELIDETLGSIHEDNHTTLVITDESECGQKQISSDPNEVRLNLNRDHSDSSLIRQTAALNMALPVNWTGITYSDDSSTSGSYNSDDQGIIMRSSSLAQNNHDHLQQQWMTGLNSNNNKNKFMCCSPDFPTMADSETRDENKVMEMSFQSPNISPILSKTNLLGKPIVNKDVLQNYSTQLFTNDAAHLFSTKNMGGNNNNNDSN